MFHGSVCELCSEHDVEQRRETQEHGEASNGRLTIESRVRQMRPDCSLIQVHAEGNQGQSRDKEGGENHEKDDAQIGVASMSPNLILPYK